MWSRRSCNSRRLTQPAVGPQFTRRFPLGLASWQKIRKQPVGFRPPFACIQLEASSSLNSISPPNQFHIQITQPRIVPDRRAEDSLILRSFDQSCPIVPAETPSPGSTSFILPLLWLVAETTPTSVWQRSVMTPSNSKGLARCP